MKWGGQPSTCAATWRAASPGRCTTWTAATTSWPEADLRVWDVPPRCLCRQHLLGEHRELHGLWNILVLGKVGYSAHPETRRWEGRLAALYARHQALVAEMDRRGYRHASPLDATAATGRSIQDRFVDPPERQVELLRSKPCDCLLEPVGSDEG